MQVEMIPVEQITADVEFNARTNLGNIEELCSSIEAGGIEVPICVHKRKKGDYSLVYGFRRFHCAKELGMDSVPAKVLNTKTPKKQLLLLNMQENTARQNLNPMDEARGAKRLLDAGFVEEEVVASLGWTPTLFTQRVQLLDYSAPLQEALTREDGITIQQARAINSLPEELHAQFIDTATSLPVGKLREMVDKELAKIDAINNPDLEEEDSGDDEVVELEEEESLDVAKLRDNVVTLLADWTTSTIGPDDETMRTKGVYCVRSIKWENLSVTDLEAFAELLSKLAEIGGFEGDADMELTAIDEGNVVSLFDGEDEVPEEFQEEEEEE